ncbi:MAG: DNA polymerase III subunit epsilon, partial [Gammaproteobacteria bacterium]|nr:DNA polymerase III subunit epsilon [Gammaproteobacteria bacterium]
INPHREIDDGAFEVHGLSNEFLADKPDFSDVAQDLIDFIKDSEVIIHNAPFDVEFINAEFKQLGREWGKLQDYCTIMDTLVMARELHPGQKNSLDALCNRYEIDNSQRDLHGALLDAQILLDVYLAMTGGQTSLMLDEEKHEHAPEKSQQRLQKSRPKLQTILPTADEVTAHQQRLEELNEKSGGQCVWFKVESQK